MGSHARHHPNAVLEEGALPVSDPLNMVAHNGKVIMKTAIPKHNNSA